MKIPGNSSVLQYGPFRKLIASKNWQNVGTKQAREEMDKMMPKMWNSQPRLGFYLGPCRKVVDCPRFSAILWKSWVIHLSPKMALCAGYSGHRECVMDIMSSRAFRTDGRRPDCARIRYIQDVEAASRLRPNAQAFRIFRTSRMRPECHERARIQGGERGRPECARIHDIRDI